MKKLISFICGLTLSLSAIAQTSVTVLEPHWSGAAKNTMIQEYTEDSLATISCYNSSDSTVFIYSDANLQAKEVIMKGFRVNDLVISGKNAYFCGRARSGDAIIGYFDVNNVFFGSGNIYILVGILAGSLNSIVKDLTRMTVFSPDDDNEHVACIGTCENLGNNRPCLIDLDADFSNLSYTGGEVDSRVEVFTDVKVVTSDEGKDYLVTAGFDTTNGRFINIRVYDPNNVFQTSGIQNTCHVYSIFTEDGRTWLNGGLLLRKLENDNFVTVSYRSATEGNNPLDAVGFFLPNIHLGFFTLSDIVNNSVWGLNRHYEIPLTSTVSGNINQVIYSGRKGKMVFLHTYCYEVKYPHSDFFELDPYALTPTGILTAYRDPDAKREGLSLYSAEARFVLSGFLNTTPTTLKFEAETFNAIPQCMEEIEYEYEQKPEIASINFDRKFTTVSKERHMGEYQPIRIELPLFKDCER